MPKNGKENFSISVDPRTMKALQAIADRKYFNNRSMAAEKAIWEFIFKELAETPEARELIYNNLDINTN
jgi:predicted transcriptional regulator